MRTPSQGVERNGSLSSRTIWHMDASANSGAESTCPSRRETDRLTTRLTEGPGNVLDVFYLVDAESSRFLYVSPAYERVWGQPVSQLYADPSSWTRIVHPDDRAAASELFLLAKTRTHFAAEYRLLHSDGSLRWVNTRGAPIHDKSGRVDRIIGVAMDVTDVKRFQLENRRLTDRLARSMEIISDALFMLDSQWRFTYLNRAAEKHLERSRADLIGTVYWEQFPEALGTVSEQSYREARTTIKTIEFERYSERHQKWFSARVYPHDDGIAVYFRDVTEAKQAEEAMRRHALRLQGMSRRLFQAEEEERRRLGRELHDQTGSNLTAMSLGLELLRSRLPGSDEGEIAMWFSDFDALLQDTIRHVRTVLTDLRPAALDELGLLAALRHYIQRTLGLTNIALQIEGTEPIPRLEPGVSIELFRVAQEAITNVVKHADATLVTIILVQNRGELRLTIQDNGKGFANSAGLKDTGSLGMATMRERAEAIGARLSVRSTPGQGTVVTIALPPKAISAALASSAD